MHRTKSCDIVLGTIRQSNCSKFCKAKFASSNITYYYYYHLPTVRAYLSSMYYSNTIHSTNTIETLPKTALTIHPTTPEFFSSHDFNICVKCVFNYLAEEELFDFILLYAFIVCIITTWPSASDILCLIKVSFWLIDFSVYVFTPHVQLFWVVFAKFCLAQ